MFICEEKEVDLWEEGMSICKERGICEEKEFWSVLRSDTYEEADIDLRREGLVICAEKECWSVEKYVDL